MTDKINDCSYDRALKVAWALDDGNLIADEGLRPENNAILVFIERAYDVPRSKIIDDLIEIADDESEDREADDNLRYGNLDQYGDPIG